MYVSVAGGTNAGWRKVNQVRKPWTCDRCGRTVAAHWTRCPHCI